MENVMVLISRQIIMCYLGSMSRGISYMKKENGRLTGLVTSYDETAF